MRAKKTGYITLMIITLFAISTIAYNTSATIQTSVQVLIENAERLRELSVYRLTLVESYLVNDTTLNVSSTLDQVRSYIATGDYYLNLSKVAYNNTDYVSARIYAIQAINNYGSALKLLVTIKQVVNISFNLTLNAVNKTSGNVTMLLVQYQRLNVTINLLRESLLQLDKNLTLSNANISLTVNITEILDKLDALQTKINIGIELLESGDIEGSYDILVEVKRELTLLRIQINKLVLHVNVFRYRHRVMRRKSVFNETDVEEIFEKIKDSEVHNETRGEEERG
ncbi:MAG: hypothetical protein DRP08_07005, partial [Candidatus Aenigmatarchaeota archaeon]